MQRQQHYDEPESIPDDEDWDASPSMISFAVAKYLANALGNPLQVVLILRQIEYSPKYLGIESSVEDGYYDEPSPDRNDTFETASESSDFSEDETLPDISLNTHPMAEQQGQPRYASADSAGYLVQTGMGPDDPMRPPFETSVLGLTSFQSMRALLRLRDETIFSLWKGCQTLWFHDIGTMILQPRIESIVSEIAGTQDQSIIPLVHVENVMPNFLAAVASYSTTEFLLSPLEIIRTRLVAQTLHPVHRKYHGTGDCFQKIVEEEGWSVLYFNRAFLPTVLHITLQALFRFGTDLVLERGLGISPEESPVTFRLMDFLGKTVEILALMPLETVRRRMYCQLSKASDRPLETVVPTNKIPYAGMLDCVGRLVTEEDSSRRDLKRRRARAKGGEPRGTWTLSPLYRGLKLRIFANASITLLRIFSELIEVE
ncbi:hypothetical protein HDU96_005848 [Phlyctochytrium bullatum]|nr:hypothetical protein HDU96_005848 [Phlyctochytrium bullatum]